MPPTIRPLALNDRAGWEQLYQAYAAFYNVTQTAQMRSTVWGWLMDAAQENVGLVAQAQDGALLGLAHFRPYSRPLSATVGGFLDDLFVAPEARGQKIAEALIAAVQDHARSHGWSVLRWITAEDNARARAVYDRVAQKTGWVTYDIAL